MSLISTGLYIYNFEYLQNGIVYWTIPLIIVLSLIISFVVFAVLMLLTAIFHNKRKIVYKPKNYYRYWVFQAASFLKVFFFLDVKFENKEILPKTSNYLLVLNHQSMFDAIAILSFFRDVPVTFIIKDSLMKIPLIGRFLHGAGFLPIDRKSNRKGLEAISLGIKRLSYGTALSIYPEGTRSRSKNLGEFRNGAFKLAIKAQVPIVVLAADGFYRRDVRMPLIRSKVLLKVCKVLEYDEFKDLHTNEIGDSIKHLIQDNINDARAKYSWLEKNR
jgi:1-acyl-sn-glycerol-3-phosphate acyltransferase